MIPDQFQNNLFDFSGFMLFFVCGLCAVAALAG